MSLQILWFCLIGAFWAVYLVLEGFDFGVGILLPFLPHDERERIVMFESIGPVWDGNEVWLVVVAGATFATFPVWYATMFSGFYLLLLVVLVCLIIRVVSFEWRTKSESPRWRATWQWANTVGSVGAPFVWGIALSALLHGVPLNSSGDFAGGFGDLLSAYTLFGGLTFVLLFAFHGAAFLTMRTTGALCERARRAATRLALPAAVVAAIFVGWTAHVAVQGNDKGLAIVLIPAVIAILTLILAVVFAGAGRMGRVFSMTALGILATVGTLFTGLYPRVLVSVPDFGNSLTISNAAAAHYSLEVVTVVALVLAPVVVLYQSWTYHVFRARISGDDVLPPASPPVPAPGGAPAP
jgi:cytochrome d ubiquinol oxidase subunit II